MMMTALTLGMGRQWQISIAVVIMGMMKAIVNKLIISHMPHHPTLRLRQICASKTSQPLPLEASHLSNKITYRFPVTLSA